jgi:uncharacterized membrane protein
LALGFGSDDFFGNTIEASPMVNGYKKWFLRGLAALLPTLITIVIFIQLFQFVNENFARHIGKGITHGIGWVWPDFQTASSVEITDALMKDGVTLDAFNKEDYAKEYYDKATALRKKRLNQLSHSGVMTLVGFVVALTVVLFLGMFLASFMGRKLWGGMETVLMRIPGIRQIYPYVKQVTDYVFGSQKLKFSKVVAIQYPRQGIWSIGFVTGSPIRAIQELSDAEYVTVFIPSSPTPVTGYVITVKKEEIVDLPLSIDQAFRFLISGGVINPETVLLSDDNETVKSESSLAT